MYEAARRVDELSGREVAELDNMVLFGDWSGTGYGEWTVAIGVL
jgi:hypothetical protein